MTRPKTVLVIDDEEDLRDTVEFKFKSKGFDVVTAVDGLDGLEKLAVTNPNLIVLDMNMPRMNGLEFYQKIKSDQKNAKYPVLVLTARANMEELFRSLDVDGFMPKPFDLDELVNEGEAIIKRSSRAVMKDFVQDVRARRVCIVENQNDVFQSVALAFLEMGYIVNSARSGASAIRRMTMDVPDVALIRLGLNDISGDIVIGKLNHMEKTRMVKCVLYTDEIADKVQVTRRISEKEGIASFVESHHPDELLEAVDALFL